MTDDEKQVSASEEYDTDVERMDPLVADAVADLALLPLEEPIDLETAAESLTEEDRQAMAALGRPVELVARVVAAAKSRLISNQVDQPTRMASSSTASTQIMGQPRSTQSYPEFDELMKSDYLRWSCEYRKKQVIGKGGQGVVFLTECLNEHNLPKALKVFSPEPYGDMASYREDMERMAHVASLVYRIQVDNLVIIERFADQKGIAVMIMWWIDGYDLARLLEPSLLEELHRCVDEDRWEYLTNVVVNPQDTMRLCLKPGMAVNIIEKCLRGLDALHSNGIVHGDIKPSNIMLDRFGSIRLVDIGSAFELSAPPRLHTWTPRYAPPEIFEGGKWTPQSDLASLGYVLIELLSGQPAIVGSEIGANSTRKLDAASDRKLLEEKRRLPERLHQLLPAHVQKSEQLMNICRRLIDPDPAKRFPSAEEALEGPDGAYQFLNGLTRMDLSVHYAQEIKRWIADVKKALRKRI